MTPNPWTQTELPVIGVASNSHSTCQACQDTIDAGEIRIGIIFQHLNGYIGMDWHHLTCCETPQALIHVEGYDILSGHDRVVLHEYIHQTEHLQTLTKVQT